MRDRIKKVMRGRCAAKGIRKERGWWDSEYKEGKIIVRRELRRGVKQDCPLSPHLFNLITADMVEVMSKGGHEDGGVRLGGIKINTLAYADDVVLIEKEEGMRSMIGKLEGYLEKKGLELNVEKSKILRFRKGGGRDKLEVEREDFLTGRDKTVIGYGVEIWGWGERKVLERLQERYLRWVFGVEWETPGYMVREELQREKLRSRTGRRG
ncbi:hypothetical protein ACFW04_012989 [Cataglyphis niger]